MSEAAVENIIEVFKEVNSVEVIREDNVVTVSSVGVQGPIGQTGQKGDTGEKGDTGNQGIQGPQGPQGATGPAGPSGMSYQFEQQVESTIWTIAHNLGYRPAVSVQDYGKINIEGEVDYIDVNNLKITFTSAISGYAYLS